MLQVSNYVPKIHLGWLNLPHSPILPSPVRGQNSRRSARARDISPGSQHDDGEELGDYEIYDASD